MASGTEALRLALQACGVGAGDEVLTASHTCVATVAAIALLGAKPVFVDVDPRTYTIDPDRLAARLTSRARAIVPVHLYGHCAEMEPILALARRFGLRVVEDCAQAHGATDRGRMAGVMGDAGCYSFYPTKNLGALGDSGLVVTGDPRIANEVRRLRHYGWSRQAGRTAYGGNSRLDELQAAVLLVKLPRLEAWNGRRRQIAAAYREGLAGTGVKCPVERPGASHAYHLYVVRVAERDRFRASLSEQGVETLIHYSSPIHRLEPYAVAPAEARELSVTEAISGEIVSLPLYPELTEGEIEAVIDAVRRATQER